MGHLWQIPKKAPLMSLSILDNFHQNTSPLAEKRTYGRPYRHSCPPLPHVTAASAVGDARARVINREAD